LRSDPPTPTTPPPSTLKSSVLSPKRHSEIYSVNVVTDMQFRLLLDDKTDFW
jgi:hypothetical protein